MTIPFKLTSGFTPRPKGYFRGKAAQASGRRFEDVVERSALIYREFLFLAMLPKHGAKRVAGGKIIPTKIPVDAMGCFKGGRALHLDAKSVESDNPSFDCCTLIADHQLIHLRKIHEQKGVAGFLVECKRRDEYLWLPVEHVQGHESIRFESPLWMPLGETTGWVRFDWLFEKLAVKGNPI